VTTRFVSWQPMGQFQRSERDRSFEIIGGTIGKRVAYPLLQRDASTSPRAFLRSKEGRVEINMVLRRVRERRGCGQPSRFGMPRLTYRGLVRQIREELRVAMSPIPSVSRRNDRHLPLPGYWYRAASLTGVFTEMSQARLGQTAGVTLRVDE
jgi:hypothetical protein